MRDVTAAAKAKARNLADRVVLPYVQIVVNAVRDGAPSAAATPEPTPPAEPRQPVINGTTDAFHNALHELRTVELERVPKGAQRVLSVGANGRWYFDWFERAVGAVDEHVGIEAFEEMPSDLPEYVTWIPDTADQMKGVENGTMDLVFAGQTTEHLWSYELAGFLEEAHRVLCDDGLLVLDSPNRIVTEHLWWSHGGHTVELSLDEISELLALAGFALASTSGIWRCGLGDRVYQLEEALDNAALFTRRAATAREAPDESFIWWLTARRTGVEPKHAELRERTKELFDAHWDTRVCRGLFPSPGSERLPIPAHHSGPVGGTLPFPLKPGTVAITATLATGSWDDVDGFTIDIVAPSGDVLHRLPLLAAERAGESVTWNFEQPHLVFSTVMQLSVGSTRRDVELSLPVSVRCDI